MRVSKFTPEQKQQLLANLDIEVAHRTRQLESWLSDTLAAFRNRHERQLTYIPHLVRGMTMADFGDKYDGDVQAALRGLQKERLAVDVAPIDRNAMKRKWAVAPEEEPETRQGDSKSDNHRRATKTPRIAPPSPQKKQLPPSANAAPSRIYAPKTPGVSRTHPRFSGIAAPSPSPRKLARIPSAPLFRAAPGSTAVTATVGSTSPNRPTAASLARQVRVPSAPTFKPTIPKTPAYPPRWPRKDESMLSINGSPLANPYELGLGWLAEGEGEGEGEENAAAEGNMPSRMVPLRRTASNIVIRRDPTFSVAGSGNTSDHHQAGRSRSNSQSQSQQLQARPDSRPVGSATMDASNSGHMSARVAVPTRDGHLLEFDPLLTSPGALDKLEGITDSAKKQAKEDMTKLVLAAVAKWNVK